jgi:hypothetical protein
VRRPTPPLLVLAVGFVLLWISTSTAVAGDSCWTDLPSGTLRCSAAGDGSSPDLPIPRPADDPGLRYVHTSTDPVVGECHFWSNIPGGLDAWDPANDPAVLATVTRLPLCPNPPALDAEVRAWDVFRSWDLAPPSPTISPPDVGITGVPSQISSVAPAAIVHSEILPDGRTLAVRATITMLTVSWGDGSVTHHDPATAIGYPDGDVAHVYELKTCASSYRREHPSGHLCHPTLERYEVRATYQWTGEFSVGGGWVELGSLDRTATTSYDVDEARGVNIP